MNQYFAHFYGWKIFQSMDVLVSVCIIYLFLSFHFHLVSLSLKYLFRAYSWVIFCIYSVNPCLLIRNFNPFTSKLLIRKIFFMPFCFLVSCVLYYFYFSVSPLLSFFVFEVFAVFSFDSFFILLSVYFSYFLSGYPEDYKWPLKLIII